MVLRAAACRLLSWPDPPTESQRAVVLPVRALGHVVSAPARSVSISAIAALAYHQPRKATLSILRLLSIHAASGQIWPIVAGADWKHPDPARSKQRHRTVSSRSRRSWRVRHAFSTKQRWCSGSAGLDEGQCRNAAPTELRKGVDDCVVQRLMVSMLLHCLSRPAEQLLEDCTAS